MLLFGSGNVLVIYSLISKYKKIKEIGRKENRSCKQKYFIQSVLKVMCLYDVHLQ